MRSALNQRVRAGVSVLFVLVLVVCWLLFSKNDLPDIDALRDYAPLTSQTAPALHCGATTVVSPVGTLKALFPALFAAEGTFKEGYYATSIARTILCKRQTPLNYEVSELRSTIQIRRIYTEDEQLTIYLNRVYFGDQPGVAAASQAYFGVTPDHLDAAQSALLMGLIRHSAYYSPVKYPDRALARRNEVLEEMKTQGSLSAQQAAAAEALPLELK